MPARATDFTPEAVAAWRGYWSDSVVSASTGADAAVQWRWIDALDRYVVSTAAADQEPITTGSTGQERENPLYSIAAKAMDTVKACEKQLGIGPQNRQALGIAIVQQKRSLADLNRVYGGPKAVAAAVQDEEDPRLSNS